jgi:hypothetical protein
MATFVLLHGACYGGWCWKKVTLLLRAAGHAVYTATLTGLGERVPRATPDVGLITHIKVLLRGSILTGRFRRRERQGGPNARHAAG